MFLRLLIALGLLVTILAKIDDAADWGIGVRGDFDQIDAAGARQGESFAQGQDSKLFTIQPDNPDLAGTNFPINPDEWTGRRRTWRIRATQDTPAGLDLFMHFCNGHSVTRTPFIKALPTLLASK